MKVPQVIVCSQPVPGSADTPDNTKYVYHTVPFKQGASKKYAYGKPSRLWPTLTDP